MAKASELRKDVINIRTGRRLGELVDVEIDEKTGRITALVVPGHSRLWGLLGGERDIVIPWHRIVRIGPDCILVDWDDGPDGTGGAGGA
ncbi:YlmC/YmxH family sporulation protein [Caldinitratiruptor microaerophilus]|uniref:PRC-barrel protein n=1 Tax=Caldinitratiruptor microaerophilus TaxID=671077 RepID=A0AA35CLJ1_9FIRM|nr:YlmC/YmxH family sporulation protein [Caldinitratiruptor microaerophilus]BDG60744.1 PRC-barrel protein [Caldinitratiruptor microaerophilus]